MASKGDKELIFKSIADEVQKCTRCTRMQDSARVLGHGVGNVHAQIMFLGEAPGRLGADQTMVPFHGDAAGDNFEDLLDFVGLSRDQLYVSNVVLCNPKDERGNNSTPKPEEIGNCSGFLKKQMDLVNPKIVVTLGATALRALDMVSAHGLTLRESVRTAHPWNGRLLIPLYHPGRRAMIHRSLPNQRSDYQFVVDVFKKTTGAGTKRKNAPVKGDILAQCKYLIQRRRYISYFELHKLTYLAEYLYAKRTGERLTKAYFIRQKDGPYCVDISINRLKRSDSDIHAVTKAGKLFLYLKNRGQIGVGAEQTAASLLGKDVLDEVLERYSFYTDADLKTAVYMTAPMRSILRREKNQRLNLYNSPIDFLL